MLAKAVEREIQLNTSALLTEHKIKMGIGQVLFCELMDQDRVEVHKLTKREQGQYSAILTEQGWSIMHLL